jgi:hypothetical protein
MRSLARNSAAATGCRPSLPLPCAATAPRSWRRRKRNSPCRALRKPAETLGTVDGNCPAEASQPISQQSGTHSNGSTGNSTGTPRRQWPP